MNKKELLLAIINLTDHCNMYDCASCDLGNYKNKCMLRNMTLPEIITKLCALDRKWITWVKFENQYKLKNALNTIKEIAKSNSGDYMVRLYAEEEKLTKDLSSGYNINETGFELLTDLLGEQNVVMEEHIKGI
jgi:hypothetical protein